VVSDIGLFLEMGSRRQWWGGQCLKESLFTAVIPHALRDQPAVAHRADIERRFI
jgi:hypothetical protein